MRKAKAIDLVNYAKRHEPTHELNEEGAKLIIQYLEGSGYGIKIDAKQDRLYRVNLEEPREEPDDETIYDLIQICYEWCCEFLEENGVDISACARGEEEPDGDYARSLWNDYLMFDKM